MRFKWTALTMLLATALLLLVAVFLPVARAAGTVVYVDGSATGLADGSSWADACTGLQEALGAAAPGDQIWVAAGTYRPTSDHGLGIGERGKHFQLKSGVTVYGGFAGMESALEDRDWAANPTTLSGDLGGGIHCYHVFLHQGFLDGTAILDGFIITAGRADDSATSPHMFGGGMYNHGCSPTLRNLSFIDNTASAGGAMFNAESSNPRLTNVTFLHNSAAAQGGAVYNLYSSPVLETVDFTGNHSGTHGGGLFSYKSDAVLENVNFSGNSAGGSGGGLCIEDSAPTLANVAFTANSALAGGGMAGINGGNAQLINVAFNYNTAVDGGGMFNDNSSPALNSVAFNANTADGSGGGMANTSGSGPSLANVSFINNAATGEGGGGGISNTDSSPTVTGAEFRNNYGDIGGGMANHNGSPLVTNAYFTENSGQTAGGAICNSHGSKPVVTNAVFSGNVSPFGGGVSNFLGSSPAVINCSFNDNKAMRGGGIGNSESGLLLANTILWGNIADVEGAQIYNTDSSAAVSHSLVESSGGSGGGWNPDLGTDGGGNLDADPLFLDAAGGNLRLPGASPAVNVGSNSALPAGVVVDLDGNPRIAGGAVDMGAYEFQEPGSGEPQEGGGSRTPDDSDTRPALPRTTGHSAAQPEPVALLCALGAAILLRKRRPAR